MKGLVGCPTFFLVTNSIDQRIRLSEGFFGISLDNGDFFKADGSVVTFAN